MEIAFVDTNVLVRHLTGDPPKMAQQATSFLAASAELLLADLIVAELVFVLSSVYGLTRAQVAPTVRSVLGLPSIRVVDSGLLHRAVEIYEIDRLDFAEAYLVAAAERSGIRVVASFDRSIDRRSEARRVGEGCRSGGWAGS